MIFASNTHEYYFKYYDSDTQRTYEVTHKKTCNKIRNNLPCSLFEPMIIWCLDTGSYIVNVNDHVATCIFICDDECIQRFVIEMLMKDTMSNLCDAFSNQQI